MEEKKEESKKIREWTKTYRLLDRKLRTMMIKTLQQNTTETKKREPSRGIARARAGLKKLRRVLQKEDVHDDAYLAKLKNAMDRTEMAILTFKENQKREWDDLIVRKNALESDLDRASKQFEAWSKSIYIAPGMSRRRNNTKQKDTTYLMSSDKRFDLGPRHGPGWHREDHDHFEKLVRKHRLAQYVSNQENRTAPTKSKLGRLFADVVKEIPDQTNQSARDHWLWYLSYNIKLNHNKSLAKQWRERKNKELESKRSVPSSSSPPPAVPTKRREDRILLERERKAEAVKEWKRKREREIAREKKRREEEERKEKESRDRIEKARRDKSKRDIAMWRAEKRRDERKQMRTRALMKRERAAKEIGEKKETEWRIRKKFEAYLDRAAEKGHVKRSGVLMDDEELQLFHRMLERREREQADGLVRRPCDPSKLSKPTVASKNMARPKGYAKSRQEWRRNAKAHDKTHYIAPTVFSVRARAMPSWRSGM